MASAPGQLGLHDFLYSDDEWAEAAGHHPMSALPAEEFALLHRHWMLANQVRLAFEHEIQLPGREPEVWPAALASKRFGFMFLWYALLWAVLEAWSDRGIAVRGRFGSDVEALSDTLRRFRNAVFHVPKKGDYVDERLVALMQQKGSALALSRVSHGLGRAFLEEIRRRGDQAPDSEDPTTGEL